MLLQPDTATDRLTNVIQVAQLGRRTGLLLVERSKGINLEEGAIIFVNGKITEARAGHRSDWEALNWLCTWDTCLFTFVHTNASEAHLPPASRPDTEPVETFRYQQMQPLAHDKQKSQFANISEFNKELEQSKISALISRVSPRMEHTNKALLAIAQAGFSRTHRQVFLLVDGVRTPTDLVRLTGRGSIEIEEILHDLENVGVIQWGKA